VALISFVVNYPCQAQQTGTTAPTPKNETSASAGSTVVIAPTETLPTRIIEEGEKVGDLTLKNEHLLVRGTVEGNITAKSSEITIESNGSVSGSISLDQSTLTNHSTKKTTVKTHAPQDRGVRAGVVHINAKNRTPIGTSNTQNNPFTQQLALLILGLLCGGVLSSTAPHATRRVSNAVALEPARCLIIGGITIVALGMLAMLNANLIHSVKLFSLAWSPFGFGLSVLMLGVLAFGWVCGLRHFGNYLAQKAGREVDGSIFGRLALGFFAIFVVSLVIGSVIAPVAVLGLLLQGLLTVMGLGASVITGFGREANWLGAMMTRGPRFGNR
jgi:hypothetical protein